MEQREARRASPPPPPATEQRGPARLSSPAAGHGAEKKGRGRRTAGHGAEEGREREEGGGRGKGWGGGRPAMEERKGWGGGRTASAGSRFRMRKRKKRIEEEGSRWGRGITWWAMSTVTFLACGHPETQH
jgi:hypothetical protein